MTKPAEVSDSLEAVLKDEIVRMYQEVAHNPRSEFHFFHGREAAELFEYDLEWLARAPCGAVDSFAGVGTPHLRSRLQPGETVIGLDLNPSMCLKAEANAAATGPRLDCRTAAMENSPLPDATVDAVLSNGVINLSFRKRRVFEELFRVLKPGGRLSFADIVSAKQLSQSIVNDPKLRAS